MDLRDKQKEFLDLAYNGEILLVARPAKRNVVLLSEEEFNKREVALKNAEYLEKLDRSFADAMENGAYEFDLTTRKFSDTPAKIQL
jgi:PHD/YefM family antitoxin component YafN of YafNO toxin-antitoxin module